MPDPKKTNDNNKPRIAKPETSTLKSILTKRGYLQPGMGVLRMGRDIVSRVALDRMAKNLEPYSYAGATKSAADRAVDAVIFNKLEENRSESDRYEQTGSGRTQVPNYRERVDLLQLLAGKNQNYNTIQESDYRPSKGDTKSDRYVSAKGIEESIISDLELDKKPIKWQKDLVKIVTDASKKNSGKATITKSGMAQVDDVPGLGTASYGVGRDKKGVYISYSDLWDLDPTEGKNAIQFEGGGLTTLEGLKNTVFKAAVKAGTYISKARATPPKVYGRIYFDQKTGKPIR